MRYFLIGAKDLSHAETIKEILRHHKAEVIIPKSLQRVFNVPSMEMREDLKELMGNIEAVIVHADSLKFESVQFLLKLAEFLCIRVIYIGDELRMPNQAPKFGPFFVDWDNTIRIGELLTASDYMRGGSGLRDFESQFIEATSFINAYYARFMPQSNRLFNRWKTEYVVHSGAFISSITTHPEMAYRYLLNDMQVFPDPGTWMYAKVHTSQQKPSGE